MPNPRAKVPPRQAFAQAHRSFDWTGIWAAAIGVIAVVLAAFVFVADGNPVAAAAVLVAVAAIIAVVLRESAQVPLD